MAAHIDESLARVGERRQFLIDYIRQVADTPEGSREVARWARYLRHTVPDLGPLLVELLVEVQAREASVVLLLLTHLADPAAAARARVIARRDDLHPDVRGWMDSVIKTPVRPIGKPAEIVDTALSAIADDAPDVSAEESRWTGSDDDDPMHKLDPREAAVRWIERWFPLAVEDRQSQLTMALAAWERDHKASPPTARHPASAHDCPILPLLELEAHWGGKSMERWVIRQLVDLEDDDAPAMLARLAHHRHVATRRAAQAALDARRQIVRPDPPCPWGDGGVCFGAGFGQEAHARPGQDAPLRGQGSVLISRQDLRGDLTYAMMMIDLEERGIVECWGDYGLPEVDLRRLLEGCNGMESGVRFVPWPEALALAVVNGAAALSIARDYVLPKEYFLWRPLVTGSPFDGRHYRLRFGNDEQLLAPWRPFIHGTFPGDAAKPW